MKKILSILTAAAVMTAPLTVSAFAEEQNECIVRSAVESILNEAVSNGSCEAVKYLLSHGSEKLDCKEALKDLLGRLDCNLPSLPNTPDDTPNTPDTPDIPGTPDTPDEPEQKPDETPDAEQTLAEQVIALVNSYRAQNGLSAVTYDKTLQKAADVRATELGSSFSHTRPNGTRCFTAFDEAGVSYRGAGENIAMGQSSAEEVMDDWMHSDGHRANILNASFTKIAVGVYENANGRLCWAQEFIY